MNKKEAKTVRVGQAVIEKKSNTAYYVEKIKPKANEEFEFECSDIATGKIQKFPHAEIKEATGIPDRKAEPKAVEPESVKKADPAPVKKAAAPQKEKVENAKRAAKSDLMVEKEGSVFTKEEFETAKFKNISNLSGAENRAIFQIDEKHFEVREVGSSKVHVIKSSSLNNAKKVWNNLFGSK